MGKYKAILATGTLGDHILVNECVCMLPINKNNSVNYKNAIVKFTDSSIDNLKTKGKCVQDGITYTTKDVSVNFNK